MVGLLLVGLSAGAWAGEAPALLPALAQLSTRLRGPAAIQALGAQLPAVAAAYQLPPATLQTLLTQHHDLWVDANGRLLYACTGLLAAPAAAPAPASTPVGAGPSRVALAVATVPHYHSKPGAPNVIFLDFDGGVYGGAWGGPFDTYAFDTDSDPTTFSDAEQAVIKRVWQRLAEDFAPFNVDVTTDAAAPGTRGVILFTQNVCRDGRNTPATGYGGIAYVGAFGNAAYWPAWVSATGTGCNEQRMAEAGAHEMGHNLGLFHDGKTDGTVYYGGHGAGDTS